MLRKKKSGRRIVNLVNFAILPKLLTIEQVSEILGIHPNTLRNWDASGKLKAVRLGSRRDRRFDREVVARLYWKTHPTTQQPVRHPAAYRPHRRRRTLKLIFSPRALGALGMAVIFPASIFTIFAAQAGELHRGTIALEPATCVGWEGAESGRHIEITPNAGIAQFTAETSAVVRRQASVVQEPQEGEGQTMPATEELLDAPTHELVCSGFVVDKKLAEETILAGVKAVISLAAQGGEASEDVISVSYNVGGTEWTPLDSVAAIGEVSNATRDGYWTLPLNLSSFDQLASLSVRVEVHEAQLAESLDVFLDGLRLDLDVTEIPPNDVGDDLRESITQSEEVFDSDESPQVQVKTEDESFFSFVGADPTVRTIEAVEIIDPRGQTVSPQYQSVSADDGDGSTTTVTLDQSNFSDPGRYHVVLTLVQDGYVEKISNDFWWGVLAVNVRRSIGLPETYTEVGVAVLNDEGRTLCDADVRVAVMHPDGRKESFSTSEKTVVINPTCEDKSFTMQADYSAYFTTSGEGMYTVTVDATTVNGDFQTVDTFEVQRAPTFDIERSEFPTRIYPIEKYPVYFTVTPTEDFRGTVREEVPAGFVISDISNRGSQISVSEDSPSRYIQWTVNWRKGQAYTLKYTFDAPDISPEYYTLGPLRITGKESSFSEARKWQIASDSTGSSTATRRWTNGFELYTNGSTPAAGVEYTSNINSPLADTGTKRSGAASLETLVSGSAATEGMKYIFSGPTGADTNLLDDVYFRAYINVTTLPSTLIDVILIENASDTDMAAIRMNTDGTLELWNKEDNAQVGSDSSALATGTWYRLELRADCTSTCAGVGSATLDARIDGVSFASATNVNWASGISGFSVGILEAATAEFNWDDTAINDDSSTDVNWAGDGKVVYSRPNGNGTNTGWSGGDYTAVDDLSASDAAYTNCTEGAATETEDYTLEDSSTIGVTSTDTIRVVQPYVRMGAGGAGAHDLTYRLIVGSDQDATSSLSLDLSGFYNNNDDGQSVNPTLTSFDYPGSAATTDNAWTTSNLDGAFIQLASTDCTPNTQVSEIWIAVEYVPIEGGRLWTSGFELQSATAGVEYDANVNSPSISTTTKRYGAASLRTNPSASTQGMGLNFASADTQDDFYFRAYFYMATRPNANTLIMAIRDNAGTNQASIRYDNANNTLELWNEEDSAQVGSDSTVVIQASRWYMLEVKVDTTTLASTALDARIDNISFASGTVNHANGVRTMQLGVITTNATADIFWDDVAINQGIGSTQNTWPGVGAVVNFQPDSTGDNTTWSGLNCAAGDNTCVDEVTPNDSTDGVIGGINAREDNNLESSSNAGIGANDTITLVHTGVRFALDVAGSQGAVTMRVKDSSGGAVTESFKIPINSTTWFTNSTTNVLPPLTAYTRPHRSDSWTQTQLDSAQVGVRLARAPGINSFYVSTMWMTVEYVPKITINGTARNSADAAFDCSVVNVDVNVSTQAGTARTTTCTAANGTFSLYADAPNNAGDPLLMYDSTGGFFATTLIMAADTTSTISNFDPRDRWVYLQSDNGGTITNAILTAGHNGSASIGYSMSSGNVSTTANYAIRVNTSDTYDPGGTITTNASGGDFRLDASAVGYFDTATTAIGRDVLINGGASLTVSATTTIVGGDITTSGTSAILTYTGTPSVTISGTGSIGGGTTPTLTLYDLTISGTQTIASAVTIDNDLAVNGTMNGSATVNTQVQGTMQGTGTISMTGGTVLLYVLANENFGTTSGTNAWTFYNLTMRNSSGTSKTITTQTGGSGGVTITNTFLVSATGDTAGTVLDAGNRTWTLSNANAADPFNIDQASGSITGNTSTFSYTGDNNTGDVTVENATYNNLSLGGSVAENYNPEGTLSVANDLTVDTNATLIGTQNITVNGTVTGAGDVALTGGTFEQRVAAAENFGTSSGTQAWVFNNLTFSNSSAASRTVTTDTNGTGSITVSITMLISKTGDTNPTVLDAGNRTWTLSNANLAAPLDADQASGSLTGNASTFEYTGDNDGGNVTVDNVTYYNLTVGGATAENYSPEGTLDVDHDLLISASGTFIAPSTLTVGGSLTNNSAFTHNSGTVTMDGTGNINGSASSTFNNLTINGTNTTVTVTGSDITVSTALTIGGDSAANTDTLSISAGRKVMSEVTTGTATLTDSTDTISGAGTLELANSSLNTSGTLSANVTFIGGGASINVTSRTYGANVTLSKSFDGGFTIVLAKAASETITIGGNLVLGSSGGHTGNLTLTGGTYNPTVNVTGNVTCGTDAETVTTGSGTWTVSGNVDFTDCTSVTATSNTLIMNGTSKIYTSGGETLNNLTLSGSITLADATHTLSGALDMTSGTITAGTSTVVMTGTANLIGNSQTLNNLTINGTNTTVTLTTSDVSVSGTLTIGGAADGDNDTLSIAVSRTLTSTSSGTVTFVASGTDTISGSGQLEMRNSNLDTDGTLSVDVEFYVKDANLTMPARTYGGDVTSECDGSSSDRTLTMGAGTHTLSGNFTVRGCGAFMTMLVEGDTNDPTVSITGNLDYEEPVANGIASVDAGAGTWTVTGNADVTCSTSQQCFDPETNGTLVMNGTSKTLTPAAETFYNFTSSGTISIAASTMTVSNALLISGGTLTGTSSTLTVGNTFTNNAAYTHNSGTVVMTGASGAINGSAATTFNHLTINGTNNTITVSNANITVSGTLTIGGAADSNDDTLSIDSGRTVTSGTAGTVTFVASGTDTISGAGTLTIQNSNLDTDGTLSANVQFDPTSGNITMPARTYGANVTVVSSDILNTRAVTMGTAGGQTINITGNLQVRDSGFGTQLTGATYDPTVNITGDITNCLILGEIAEYITGTGTWTVTGSVALTSCNVTTEGTHTLVMNGTSNTLTGPFSGSFINLTIDPSSAGTITFQTRDATLTSTLTVASGDTFSIASGRTFTMSATSAEISGTGTISGAGTLRFLNGSAGPGTALGTLSSIVRYDATSGDVADTTIDARTYGGKIEFFSSSTTARNLTLASGTYTLSGSSSHFNVIANGASPGNVTVIGATNNPTVTIGGDLDFTGTGSSSEVITSGTGTWTAGGNVNFTDGTYTAASGNTLIMNGTGTLTSNAQTLHHLTLSGTVTLANATHTVNGDLSMAGGTITAGTSTVTMTGTSNSITGGSQTLNNLTIDPSSAGTITLQTSGMTVSGTLTVAASDALTISSGITLTHSGATLTLSGTINGPGRLTYRSATTFPTSGTLAASLILRFDTTSNDQTMPVRTDYQSVEVDNSGTTAGRALTADVGTISIAGSLELLRSGSDPGTVKLELNTNDPTFTVTGATTIGANTTLSANSANALNINGNYTNNGTFTDNSGTVTAGGSAQQTFAGTMTGSSNDFNNLTITNSSGSDPVTSPSVIFSAAATTASTFTATTANTKIRFNASATYTFQNISFNGQASGTRVYLRSSSTGTQWNINVAGTRSVSNTDVRDSNACGQAPDIDASDGTNFDAGNNNCWNINTITLSISDTTIGFGTLTSGAARWATGDAAGSSTDSAAAHTLSVTSNARSGYAVTYFGPTLTYGAQTIDAATITDDADGTAGTEQFAIGFSTSGNATIASGYDHNVTPANRDWNFVPSTTTVIVSETGPTATETVSAFYLANITSVMIAGTYTTNIRYVMTATY